jgi:LysR family glycine cleavage system transcriptional activator
MNFSNNKGMRKRLPPLNALRTFEAAARHGSFRAAGDELCVSHSAISHQIKKLEQYLGVELFLRVAKGVELSKAGSEYYPTIRSAFDRISDGTELILSPRAPGIVTVQVYSTFAIRWLIPRMPEFQARHPHVMVRLHTSQSDVNFEHEDVDMCVMIGTPSHTDLHYDHLFTCRVFPVCSPALLEGNNRLEEPQDLSAHTIIQVYPSEQDWWVWLEENQVHDVNPNSGLQFDSYDLAYNTAVQGLGVALGMEPFVNRELEAGTLLEPFPGRRVFPHGDWYLACRSDKADNKEIRTFRDWLLQEIRKDETMPESRHPHGKTTKDQSPP